MADNLSVNLSFNIFSPHSIGRLDANDLMFSQPSLKAALILYYPPIKLRLSV